MVCKHTILLSTSLLLLASATSCDNSDPISGSPIEIRADYVLPQEGASEAANQFIVDLYNQYGSYFLYRFEIDENGFSKDATWVQETGSASQRYNVVMTLGDPAYVETMMQLLQQTWLQFFPEDFLRNGGIPYRVFLCDEQYDWRQIGDWYQRIDHQYQFYGYSVTLAGLNNKLGNLTANDKLAYKYMILPAMWDYYTSNGILEVPSEFYDLTDYSNEPELPGKSEEALDAYRKRGFIPMEYDAEGKPKEFWQPETGWSMAKTYDLLSYMHHLREWPEDRIQPLLDDPRYPLIKRKYEVLYKFYLEKYGIDLKKMGNARY